MSFHPGLKHPTSQNDSTELAEVLRRGWPFGVTYHNMRARHSVSDGGLGCSVRPLRGHRKMSKLHTPLLATPGCVVRIFLLKLAKGRESQATPLQCKVGKI